MTLPASFTAATAQGVAGVLTRWLEVAGLPTAYGTADMAGSWWAGRAAADRFASGLGALAGIPEVEPQELDPLAGLSSRASAMTVLLQDQDGQPPVWLGVGLTTGNTTLASPCAVGDTSLVLTSAAGFPSSGVVYVGLETMTYSAKVGDTLTISQRGAYRSPVEAHPLGKLASPRPYAMKGRRAWYYLAAVPLVRDAGIFATVPASFQQPEDADKVLRFTGTLERIRTEQPGLYQLAFLSMQKMLDRKVLRDLRTVRDTGNAGITGPDGDEPGVRAAGGPGSAATTFLSDDLELFADSEEFLLRVDDEVLAATRSGASFALTGRGLFSTAPQAHAAGWTGREVCGLARYDAAGTLEQQFSKFTSAASAAHPLAPDHPLAVFLQFLVSTGTGLNTVAGQRNYDTLPAGWGVGLDAAMVDFAGVERAADWVDEVQLGGVLADGRPFPDLVRQILSPLGLYAMTTLGELVTVRVNRPPLPDETSRAVDSTTRQSLGGRGSRGTLDSNYDAQVQQVEVRYGWDLVDGKPKRIHVERYTLADQYSGGTGREISYDFPLLYPGDLKVPGAPPARTFDPEGLLLKMKDFFIQRFAVPPALIEETVGYSLLDLEPGDMVTVTDAQLPDPVSGAMGLANRVAQVVGKAVNEADKTIRLTLLLTGYQAGGSYRYIAPALEISSVISSTVFEVAANAFTDAVSGQTDLELLKPDGTLRAVFTGAGPWTVARYGADGAVLSSSVTVTAVNTGTRRLTVASTTGYAAGQVVAAKIDGSSSPFDPTIYARAGQGQRYMP